MDTTKREKIMKIAAAEQELTNNALIIVQGALEEGYSLQLKLKNSADNNNNTIIIAYRDRDYFYSVKNYIHNKPITAPNTTIYYGEDSWMAAFDFLMRCEDHEDAIKIVSAAVKKQVPSIKKRHRAHTKRKRYAR
jgi:hypothetical protein